MHKPKPPRPKKHITLEVLDPNATRKEKREVDTIEEELRKLAREAAKGELPLPYQVTFPGPGNSEFTIIVKDRAAAEGLTTFGFMF